MLGDVPGARLEHREGTLDRPSCGHLYEGVLQDNVEKTLVLEKEGDMYYREYHDGNMSERLRQRVSVLCRVQRAVSYAGTRNMLGAAVRSL